MPQKTIVITGASSGIGEAAAKALARDGAHLCLVARREDELARVKADIERAGGSATIYPTDLSDLKAIDACCASILHDHPQIDVLINNAGRSIRRPIKESLDRFHDYERTMQLNYFGALRMTFKLLPRFYAQRRGHIINISSLSALVPTPYFSAYVASKCALEGFSRSLSAELTGSGINVTTINYPLVKTPMTAPTKIYKYLPQMDVDVAASWIVKAVKQRPTRKTSIFGETFSVITTALPGTTTKGFGLLFKAVGKRLQKRAEKEQG
jgi:short-subunit dehydrogenase